MERVAGVCGACGVGLHFECWDEAGVCPSLGCEQRPMVASRARTLVAAFAALFLALAALEEALVPRRWRCMSSGPPYYVHALADADAPFSSLALRCARHREPWPCVPCETPRLREPPPFDWAQARDGGELEVPWSCSPPEALRWTRERGPRRRLVA